MTFEQAQRSYEKKAYMQALALFVNHTSSLLLEGAEREEIERSMRMTVQSFELGYPREVVRKVLYQAGIDLFEQYFQVVRYFFDSYEEDDHKKILEEITREIPLAEGVLKEVVYPENYTETDHRFVGPHYIAIVSSQGPRESLEDYAVAEELPRAILFAVMDGHGGKGCAQFIERRLPIITREELGVIDVGDDLAMYNALVRVALRLDRSWEEGIADRRSRDYYSGSTLCAAFLVGNTLWVANVGDSRAVLVSQGKALQLSEEAKPTYDGYFEEIFLRGGLVLNGRVDGSLDMARSIGDAGHPSVSPRPTIAKCSQVSKGDRLIIACDGLWDVVDTAVAADIVAHKGVEVGAETLKELAFKNGTTDNVTILLVEIR